MRRVVGYVLTFCVGTTVGLVSAVSPRTGGPAPGVTPVDPIAPLTLSCHGEPGRSFRLTPYAATSGFDRHELGPVPVESERWSVVYNDGRSVLYCREGWSTGP